MGGDIWVMRAQVTAAWRANPMLATLRFGAPSLVFSHAAQGNQPKYLINPIIALNGGARLALPVSTWGSASDEGRAGLLFSDDDGASWTPQASGFGALGAPGSPDLEPAFAPLGGQQGPNASYVTLRVRGGGMYQSWSNDSVHWPQATAAALPSADSKTNLLLAADGSLLLTHNVHDRKTLLVQRSENQGRSWTNATVLSTGTDGLQRCYPTTVAMPPVMGEDAAAGAALYASVYSVYPTSGPRVGIALTFFHL